MILDERNIIISPKQPFFVMATTRYYKAVVMQYGEFKMAIALLNDGRIQAEPMITGRIKLEDIIEKGFEELVNHKEENIKILVSPF